MTYLGIDIGGTKVAAGLVDENGVIMKEIYMELENTDNQAIDEAIEKIISELSGFSAIGIGVPGTLDRSTKTWVKASNLKVKQWSPKSWEERLKVPVELENDANCAALGESWVSNRKDLILLTLGTGVGMGIVIRGRIFTGVTGLAGEVGHITIYPNGRECSCGKRGCLEAYAGGWGIAKNYGDSPKLALQDRGSPIYKEVVESLSIGMHNLAVIFGLKEIFLSGTIALKNPDFISQIEEKIKENFGYSLRLNLAKAGNKAGLIGAAALCRKEA